MGRVGLWIKDPNTRYELNHLRLTMFREMTYPVTTPSTPPVSLLTAEVLGGRLTPFYR